MDNPEKLAILGTRDKIRRQTKQKHNMLWTLLYTNKHKNTNVNKT
jgi:hypothetical protein